MATRNLDINLDFEALIKTADEDRFNMGFPLLGMGAGVVLGMRNAHKLPQRLSGLDKDRKAAAEALARLMAQAGEKVGGPSSAVAAHQNAVRKELMQRFEHLQNLSGREKAILSNPAAVKRMMIAKPMLGLGALGGLAGIIKLIHDRSKTSQQAQQLAIQQALASGMTPEQLMYYYGRG